METAFNKTETSTQRRKRRRFLVDTQFRWIPSDAPGGRMEGRFWIDPGSPAERAGLAPGMQVGRRGWAEVVS